MVGHPGDDLAQGEAEAAELHQLVAQPGSDVVVDELREGIRKAARANVDGALVEAAKELLKEAEKRDGLAERVLRLTHLPELTLDIEKTVGTWGEAIEAGVAKEPALKLQETMRRAAESRSCSSQR